MKVLFWLHLIATKLLFFPLITDYETILWHIHYWLFSLGADTFLFC